MKISERLFNGRSLFHFGGALLCLGLATWLFFSSPPATSPLAQPSTSAAPVQGNGWYTTSRGAIVLYGVGFVLLVTGGRSDAEKRGYNF